MSKSSAESLLGGSETEVVGGGVYERPIVLRQEERSEGHDRLGGIAMCGIGVVHGNLLWSDTVGQRGVC